jgi:RNA recognition motif-containing protein
MVNLRRPNHMTERRSIFSASSMRIIRQRRGDGWRTIYSHEMARPRTGLFQPKGDSLVESKLYVGNLSYNVTEEQLRALFSQAGAIKEITLIMDRDTQRPKGFGFVEMATQVEAQKAIEMFNEHELDGRRLAVNFARPKEDRSGSRGGQRKRY